MCKLSPQTWIPLDPYVSGIKVQITQDADMVWILLDPTWSLYTRIKAQITQDAGTAPEDV